MASIPAIAGRKGEDEKGAIGRKIRQAFVESNRLCLGQRKCPAHQRGTFRFTGQLLGKRGKAASAYRHPETGYERQAKRSH
jgi:hypothetical protein